MKKVSWLKKAWPIGVICLLIVVLVCFYCSGARQADIAVLFTSDIHCTMDGDIGYEELAYLKNQLASNGDEVILVDTGDAIQGGAMGSFSKGADIIRIMNTVGYDAMTLGNHEFDYGGPGRVAELAEMAQFPFLSANFQSLSTGKRVYDAYTILKRDGVKIAFIGISTPETIESSTPSYYKDENGNMIYGFMKGDEGKTYWTEIQKVVDEVKRKGADYVVAMTHLGIEEGSVPYDSRSLLQNTTGIDVCLDGHAHVVIECERVRNKDGELVLLSSAGTAFEQVGLLYIDKNGNLSTGMISEINGEDQTVLQQIEAIKASYAQQLEQVVGRLENDLVIADPKTGERLVRRGETNLGDFCADAYRYSADADIAFLNGGGVRVALEKGDVTYGELLSVHPFGNLLCKANVKGSALLDALEYAVYLYPNEHGSFLHVSGIRFTIDSTVESSVEVDENGVFVKIAGQRRVRDVKIGEEDLDLNKTYSVVSQNYILKNPDGGFAMLEGIEMVMDEYILDVDAITEYFRDVYPTAKEQYANPYGAGRIQIVQ